MKSPYEAMTEKSLRLYRRAEKVFAGGVNHNARYYEPYPFYVKRAQGQHVWDEDGNKYTDYWMGHMALILGHSPRVVVDALAEQIGNGTHFGTSSRLSVELGEEIQRTVPCAEMLRFCSSGAEATMYLVRLARGFTGRRMIVKMAGGWHGYNTELNKGVHSLFDRSEGAGILPGEQEFVKSVRFNDIYDAEKLMRTNGRDVAAIFLEPVLGAGGCIPADPDYLRGLRELADEHGALLAFDEIITGFRVALGGAQERYGVKPDLASFGKVAGGGLPVGLVCGRKEIISRADPRRKRDLVSIGGGTFSENPLSMTAGLSTLRYLRRNRARVYGQLESMGVRLREGIDDAAAANGVETHTTGMGSLFLVHFPEEPRNASVGLKDDKKLTDEYALDLMSRGIFNLPGHPGAVSTVHTKSDIDRLLQSTGSFCRERRR